LSQDQYNPITLSSTATRQEIFNAVSTFLLKQGRKSTYRNESLDVNSCAYRGDDGTMCAVGCVIPNEMYKSEFENLRVTALVERFSNLPEFLVKEEDLFVYLQRAHDNNKNFSDMKI
jgi:hypothetical protein